MSASPRRIISISDVHLGQAHAIDPNDPYWMRYRAKEHHPDAELSSLIDHLLETFPNDELELVFNGDVLDFDVPLVKDGKATLEESPLTEEGCAEHLLRIIADHTMWFDAVARLLARGHSVTWMAGNHDSHLSWPGVQRALRSDLAARLAQAGATVDLEAQLRFHTWFYITPERIYFEHGSQYDHFASMHHPVFPVTRDRERIHPTLSSQAFKRIGAHLGYFNPYLEETFMMTLLDLVKHYREYYLGTGHQNFGRWIRGAAQTLMEMARERRGAAERAQWIAQGDARAVLETGATLEAVVATRKLGSPPAEDTFLPLVREVGFDRLAFVIVIPLLTLLGALFGGIAWASGIAFVLVLLVGAYEALVPKPDIRTYDSPPVEIRNLYEIHSVRALCLGHTHRSFGHWSDDRFHGNSGNWAPVFRDAACEEPLLSGRPFLMLEAEEDRIWGGLFWWKSGRIEPDAEARLRPSAPSEPAAPERAIAHASTIERARPDARARSL